MKQKKNYVPFGKEWEKEIMKPAPPAVGNMVATTLLKKFWRQPEFSFYAQIVKTVMKQ